MGSVSRLPFSTSDSPWRSRLRLRWTSGVVLKLVWACRGLGRVVVRGSRSSLSLPELSAVSPFLSPASASADRNRVRLFRDWPSDDRAEMYELVREKDGESCPGICRV